MLIFFFFFFIHTPTSSGLNQHLVCGYLRKAEDEEVFEEIRRLRLERGRLLQKIKGLEQQQQSALSALKEVLHSRSGKRLFLLKSL